jgi:hypothetical protein
MHAQVQAVIDDAVLSYHVYNSTDHVWLGDSMQTPKPGIFVSDYNYAASFATFEEADKAMQLAQKKWPDDVLYVMACMPSTG